MTFLTSRAREGFTNIEARAQLIQIALSLRRPLRVRRGSQGLRNQNRRLPTTRLPIGVKILASDLRTSVPAHGSSHSPHGTYLGPTRGLVGACPNERRSLVPPPGMASRLARFARRTGLRYFANLDPVGAIVGNPAERLNGIQTTTRKADTSYERPRRTLL